MSRPLVYGSIRHALWQGGCRFFGGFDLPPGSQCDLLLRGRPVVFSREHLEATLHPNEQPANLADHAEWRLTGDNTLTPVT